MPKLHVVVNPMRRISAPGSAQSRSEPAASLNSVLERAMSLRLPEAETFSRCEQYFDSFVAHNTRGWVNLSMQYDEAAEPVITVEQLQALLEGAEQQAIPIAHLELLLAELGFEDTLTRDQVKEVVRVLVLEKNKATALITRARPKFIPCFFCLLFFALVFPFFRVSEPVRAVSMYLFSALRVPLSWRKLLFCSEGVSCRLLGVSLLIWSAAALVAWGVVDLGFIKTEVPLRRHGCPHVNPKSGCSPDQVPGLAVSSMERMWTKYMYLVMCVITAIRISSDPPKLDTSLVLHSEASAPSRAAVRLAPAAAPAPAAAAPARDPAGAPAPPRAAAPSPLSAPSAASADSDKDDGSGQCVCVVNHPLLGPRTEKRDALFALTSLIAVDTTKWRKARASFRRNRLLLSLVLPLPCFVAIYFQRVAWGIGPGGHALFGRSNDAGMAWACISSSLSAYVMLFYMFFWLGDVHNFLRCKYRWFWNLRRLIDPAVGPFPASKEEPCIRGEHHSVHLPLHDPNNVAVWRSCREFALRTGPSELREANVQIAGGVVLMLLLFLYMLLMRVQKRLNSASWNYDEDMLVLTNFCVLAIVALGGYMLYPSLFIALFINNEHEHTRLALQTACFDVHACHATGAATAAATGGSQFSAVLRRRNSVSEGEQHVPAQVAAAAKAAAAAVSAERMEASLSVVDRLVSLLTTRDDTLHVMFVPLNRKFFASVTTLLVSGAAMALSYFVT